MRSLGVCFVDLTGYTQLTEERAIGSRPTSPRSWLHL